MNSDEPSPPPFCELEQLKGYCSEVVFSPGEALRTKGLLSVDMYLLIDGEVEVKLERDGRTASVISVGGGSPIGEIGFLTGRPATATVTAKTASRTLYRQRDMARVRTASAASCR